MSDDPIPTGSLITTALREFGLHTAQGWRAEHIRTLNNSVYAVRRAARPPEWVLRRHRQGGRRPGAISSELSLLDHLVDRLSPPISVPQPAVTPDGRKVVTVNGEHFSLLSWISGAPRRPDNGLDSRDVALLGQALGEVHTATDGWTPPKIPVTWDAPTLFGEHPGLLGRDPRDLDDHLSSLDQRLFDEVAHNTRLIFDGQTDWGVIHADYILGNCHWPRSADARLGILDFDDFGIGPRLYDLGAVLGNLADFAETWQTNSTAFLAGYRSAHRLGRSAEADLPIIMAARHISHCLWAIGHRDRGQDWIADHLLARLSMARECLAVTF